MKDEGLSDHLDAAIESGITLANQYIRQSSVMKGENASAVSHVLRQMVLSEVLHVQLIAETMKCTEHLPQCKADRACPARIRKSIREMLRIDRKALYQTMRLYNEIVSFHAPGECCLLTELFDQLIQDEEGNYSILNEFSSGFLDRRPESAQTKGPSKAS